MLWTQSWEEPLSTRRIIEARSAGPAVGPEQSGGLMACGPTAEESTERAAAMLDRVLRGAKPADIPVELASRVELIVNKDAVAAMKLTLLPSLQARVQRWFP